MASEYQYCIKCGGQVKVGTSFCPTCGAPVTVNPSAGYQQQTYTDQSYQQPYAGQNYQQQPYVDPNYQQQPYVDPNYQQQPYVDPNYQQQPYVDPNYQQQPYVDPNYQQGYAQPGYQQGYAQQGYQTGQETPFLCPQCGNKTVIRVKSSSDTANNKVGIAMIFGLSGLLVNQLVGKNANVYNGSVLDLMCKTCGAAFPSQEAWSKAIVKQRRQVNLCLILAIVLLVCAFLLFICRPMRLFGTIGVFFIIIAVMALIVGILAFVLYFLTHAKLGKSEKEFQDYGRKINGIGRPY